MVVNSPVDSDGKRVAITAQEHAESLPIWRDRPVVNRERCFRIEELFFSITDKKGIISFANDIFTRISAYTEDELLGEPHNIIRHPDMPRAVFFVLWDFLEKGKPVAAYVKNRAKDGCYYWVMALVFPCAAGYLSIRLKPGSPVFQKIQKHYSEVLIYEREQMAKRGRQQGMMDALANLLQRLAADGFDSYDDFMWAALESEMQNRERALTENRHVSSRNNDKVPKALLGYEAHLGKLFSHAAMLHELNDTLMQHASDLIALSSSIENLALNAQMGASRLADGEGDALSAVAGLMGEQAVGGGVQLEKLQAHVDDLSQLLHHTNFYIVTAKLQVEMSAEFIGSLDQDGQQTRDGSLPVQEVVELLREVYEPNLERIAKAVAQVPGMLQEVQDRIKSIQQFLYVLRFIYIAGKIEVARLETAGAFANTFNDLIREVGAAKSRLRDLSRLVEHNQRVSPLFLESSDALAVVSG